MTRICADNTVLHLPTVVKVTSRPTSRRY